MGSSRLRFMAAGIVLTCAASQAAASIYTFFDLGALPGNDSGYALDMNNAGHAVGFSFDSFGSNPFATLWKDGHAVMLDSVASDNNSVVNAISNSGQMAGTAVDDSYFSQPVRWTGAGAKILPTLGGHSGEALDINDAGHVVGFSQVANNAYGQATLWTGNSPQALGALIPKGESGATAINNSGQVAGFSYTADNSVHAVRWDNKVVTDLGALAGGDYSHAYDINDVGQVTGYSTSSSGSRATRWDGDTIVDLGTLGGMDSHGYAINNSGQVVGWSLLNDDYDSARATLWNGNTANDLNNYLDASVKGAGWVLKEARGINDQGSIVGIAFNSYQGQRAFLLSVSSVSPVPEPETYLMMLIGLGVVSLVVWRKRERVPFAMRTPLLV